MREIHHCVIETVKSHNKRSCRKTKECREAQSSALRIEGERLRLQAVVEKIEKEADNLEASLEAKSKECSALRKELSGLREEMSSLRGTGVKPVERGAALHGEGGTDC